MKEQIDGSFIEFSENTSSFGSTVSNGKTSLQRYVIYRFFGVLSSEFYVSRADIAILFNARVEDVFRKDAYPASSPTEFWIALTRAFPEPEEKNQLL